MDNSLYVLLGVGAPVAAALFALSLIRTINACDPGSERMQQIAALIRRGAMAFLRTEYSVLAVFVVVMFGVLVLFLPGDSLLVGVSFLVGALLSASAGWVGMRTATGAAVRTTAAAQTSLAGALRVAFSSGAVMGLTVVALGTLGIALLYWLYGGLDGRGPSAVGSLLGLSLGASSIALFARVGGGIFTKAADVAGDLSGKVEAGIPEDDPRNPATIADSVGDNVGDVAGMGADLFESYVGSIISSVALAWALTAATAFDLWGVGESGYLAPAGRSRGVPGAARRRRHRRLDPGHVHGADRRREQGAGGAAAGPDRGVGHRHRRRRRPHLGHLGALAGHGLRGVRGRGRRRHRQAHRVLHGQGPAAGQPTSPSSPRPAPPPTSSRASGSA